jgi:hypothetical protein
VALRAATALAALVALGPAAQPAAAATLTVSPDSGPAGSAVTASGSGYKACLDRELGGERVALYWDDRPAATVESPFSTALTVPGDFAPGGHELSARCATAATTRTLARAAFRVTEAPTGGPQTAPGTPATPGVSPNTPRAARPKLTVTPSDPRAGDRILLRARRFPSGPCSGGRIEFYLREVALTRAFERDDPADALARSRIPRDAQTGPARIAGRCGLTYALADVTIRAATAAPSRAHGRRSRAAGGPLGPPAQGLTPPGAGTALANVHPHEHLTSAVPTAKRLPVDVPAIGWAIALGALLVLLLAFPAELFNQTYGENEAEIHGILGRVGWRSWHLPPWAGFVAFALVGGALSAWLALGQLEGSPVARTAGLILALLIVTFAFRLPIELYSRAKSAIAGTLEVLPAALVVAAACAVASQALGLKPSYLYGVFVGFAAARAGALTRENQGRAVLIGAAVAAAAGLVAWLGWGAIDGDLHDPGRGWAATLAATTLFWTFVLTAESLVFALVPLRFLDGAALRRWHGGVWLAAQLVAAAFLAYVLMLRGSTAHVDAVEQLVKPFALFAAFGLFSFAFWGYFRWERRPTAPGAPRSAPDAQPVAVRGEAARSRRS